MLERLMQIGERVDKIDYKLMNGLSLKEDLLDLLVEVECEFNECEEYIEDMNAVEKIVYRYTLANYLFALVRLAQENFIVVKGYSTFIQVYKDVNETYIQLNIEILELYRGALDIYNENPDIGIRPEYIAQISTNLANLYFDMGRVVESIELLRGTVKSLKQFPMALGNYAIKCFSLIDYCTDSEKNKFLIDLSLEILDSLLGKEIDVQLISPDQIAGFERWRNHILLVNEKSFSEISAWESNLDVDQKYKKWCVRNNLSLNYINIVSEMGNVDDLHIPNMGVHYWSKDEGKMTYYSWFNIIKQEYNFARFQLYQIDTENYQTHASQFKNILVNSLDYPSHGYKTEKLKSTLKSVYAVLDKIGLFCGHFFEINTKPGRIDFNNWYKDVKVQVAVESPFNALYWLSQDFDYKEGHYKDIRRLRNVIEHRYLRILDYAATPLSLELSDTDKYEYNVSYSDLLEFTYEIFKLIKSAIFYMINGFNVQYKNAITDIPENYIFLPLYLDEYEDEWKN